MESYTSTGQDTNPYIYHPKRMQKSYFSPRSAERGSNIIKVRHMFSSDALICALAGTIGESAARDIQAFIEYQDQLPSKADIVNNPTTARLPTTSGAAAVMTYTMITLVDKDSINPFMDYLERLAPEWQATFCISIAKDTKKQGLAFKCQKLSNWVARNEDLL
jgi:hypothetical protein